MTMHKYWELNDYISEYYCDNREEPVLDEKLLYNCHLGQFDSEGTIMDRKIFNTKFTYYMWKNNLIADPNGSHLQAFLQEEIDTFTDLVEKFSTVRPNGQVGNIYGWYFSTYLEYVLLKKLETPEDHRKLILALRMTGFFTSTNKVTNADKYLKHFAFDGKKSTLISNIVMLQPKKHLEKQDEDRLKQLKKAERDGILDRYISNLKKKVG